MKIATSFIIMLILTSGAISQHIPGSIELKECRGCQDIVERPTVYYPAYVGYGPHKFEGDVGVQILIGKDGNVISAKAIFGHPYFRSILVKGALRAKFNVANPETKRDAILVFKVTPPSMREIEAVGIINGRAFDLPKPEYGDELKNLCASGEVKLKVQVSEAGNVLQAKPISGDELLYESSIKAIRGARFQTTHGRPVAYGGVIVYNFPSEKKCLDVGSVNGKWVGRPSFSVPNARVDKATKISIRLGIEPFSGIVLAARAINADWLIRQALEKQALKVKFHPSLINSKPFIVKGIITVTLLPSGKIAF